MNPVPESLAAVDLGSNSFHMVVARAVGGEPVIVDRLREQVQLAAGLDEDKEVRPEAWQRALECLARFGQRIREFPAIGVRAVATNTLRDARNARELLETAEAALGYPIEIISGTEEARLIYLGVSHTLAEEFERRLVVDIGGGSTECILGERFEPVLVDSFEMGCVGYSRRFFEGGAITPERFDDAVLAARLELRTIERRFRGRAWSSAAGASGTIRAVEEILRANGWAKRGITAPGLDRLRERLLDAEHVDELDIPGLKKERAPVFPGGLAILVAVFEGLEIARMEAASGALREGVLFDLLGRLQHEDARDRTIALFQKRYHVDEEQAERVERTALGFLAQVAAPWQMEEEEAGPFLSWAARLHEIGLAVSYSGHHRHGAYLVANSDMAGFSRDNQNLLATLIRAHRRKIRRGMFRDLPRRQRHLAKRLAVILRLAVRFHRERSAEPRPEIRLDAGPETLRVLLPEGWLDGHPLTRTDLEAEADRVAAIGLTLSVDG
jgi:exopolyphosphatase/guanosine-5'-triphosphate,3'-diphosphate pyrophosphatase